MEKEAKIINLEQDFFTPPNNIIEERSALNTTLPRISMILFGGVKNPVPN
jgi:hypothetical protein